MASIGTPFAETRLHKQIASARRYQQRLERRPWVAFPLESVRRFNKIDGKHLALVIALNLFVAVIPLIIIGYAGASRVHRYHRLLLGMDRRRDGRLVGAQSGTSRRRHHGETVSRRQRVMICRPAGARRQAPLSAIFCCASAMAPLRALTWWPSASPTALVMARVTAGSTLAAAECG